MKRVPQYVMMLTLVFVTICTIILAYLFFRDSTAPHISLSPDTNVISAQLPFELLITDEDSGVKKIQVIASWGGKTLPVLEQVFSDKQAARRATFSLKDALPKTGSITLEIIATDHARFGIGNTAREMKTYIVDNAPPKLSIKTSPPNIRRGGSAVVLYAIDKEVAQTGIKVGELFFPAFRQADGQYLCFFAFPYYLTVDEYKPVLVALDQAGNLSSVLLQAHKIHREFKRDRITISQNFLDQKAEEFKKILPAQLPPLEHFLKINQDVRAANTKTLAEIGRQTTSEVLWSDAFLALPRGAVRASFGEHRTYLWQNAQVDEQVHLGYDLASTSNAPIPAANAGIVVFADYLGIFGNLVVIDHGLGLQSLYSHLSEIDVKLSQAVKRGEIIGRTGVSGLALGDHLHFGILLGGIEVSPLEWLDPQWIRHNIIHRLKEAGGQAPAFFVPAVSPLTPSKALTKRPKKSKKTVPSKSSAPKPKKKQIKKKQVKQKKNP